MAEVGATAPLLDKPVAASTPTSTDQSQRARWYAILSVIFILDCVGSNLLFWHGTWSESFGALEPAFAEYSFAVSLVDLWVISCIKCVVCVVLLAVAFSWRNARLPCLYLAVFLTLSGALFGVAKVIPLASSPAPLKFQWGLTSVLTVLSVVEMMVLWQFLDGARGLATKFRTEEEKEEWFWAEARTKQRRERKAQLVGAPPDELDFEAAVEELVKRSKMPGGAKKKGGGEGGGGEGAGAAGDVGEKDEEGGEDEDDETKGRVSATSFIRVLKMMTPDWMYILAGFISLAVASAGNVFLPHFMGQVIDHVAISRDPDQFHNAILFLIGTSAVMAVASALRGSLLTVAMTRLKVRIRQQLFESVMRQELGWFDGTHTGEITSRLSADTTRVGDSLSLNVNIFLRNVLQLIGVLVFCFIISWRLSLTCFSVVIPILLVSKIYGEFLSTLYRRVQRSLALANQVAEEAISSMTTVRSMAAEKFEEGRHGEELAVFFDLNMQLAVAYGLFVVVVTLLPTLATAALLYVGGQLVFKNALSAGQLVTFLLYQITLTSSFASMGDVFTGLAQAAGAAAKIFAMIDREPAFQDDGTLKLPRPATTVAHGALEESKDDTDGEREGGGEGGGGGQGVSINGDKHASFAPTFPPLRGEMELRDVTFAYPSRPDVDVLKGLSIKALPGQVVALVGASGGGKSSVIKLLERFYEPKSGRVLMDGRDLGEYERRWRHRAIALVSQEPTLFGASVLENLTYGLEEEVARGEVTFDDVVEACELANALNFIKELPKQFDEHCGERGVQLSGGQRQRIAIARALLRKPSVLLLDEATSALDAESEFLVQQALDRVMIGRTVIVVAHRLSTIKGADAIYVLKGGVAVEKGTHAELLRRKGGAYAKLVARQVHGIAEEVEEEGEGEGDGGKRE